MQPRSATMLLPITFTAMLVALPLVSTACDTCNPLRSNALALPHPRAIELAVATRAATVKGLLSDHPVVPRATLSTGGTGLVALHKVPAPLLVESWVTQLAESMPQREAIAVHFLFIDTEQ